MAPGAMLTTPMNIKPTTSRTTTMTTIPNTFTQRGVPG
jgi:hypothetical protein